MLKELKRKGVHLLSLTVVLSLYLLGKKITHLLLVVVTGVALIIELARIDWKVKTGLEELLRKKEKQALTGATHFLLGATIATSVLPINYAAAVILFVTLGDLVAALVGKLGRVEVLRGKKFEGILAELLTDMAVALLFVGPLGIPAALLATLVETFSFRTDDNLLITVVSTLYFMVVGWAWLK